MRFLLTKCGKCGNADLRKTSGNTAFLRFATLYGVQLRNLTRAIFAKVSSISTCVNPVSGQSFGLSRRLSPEILSSRTPQTRDSSPGARSGALVGVPTSIERAGLESRKLLPRRARQPAAGGYRLYASASRFGRAAAPAGRAPHPPVVLPKK